MSEFQTELEIRFEMIMTLKRVRLPELTPEQDYQVQAASMTNPRAIRYRAARAQVRMWE